MSNYNELDYSSISKISKSDDSMIHKGAGSTTDYLQLLKNAHISNGSMPTPQTLKSKFRDLNDNLEMGKEKDNILYDFYKTEDYFKLDKVNQNEKNETVNEVSNEGDIQANDNSSIQSGIQFKNRPAPVNRFVKLNVETEVQGLNRSFSSINKKQKMEPLEKVTNPRVKPSSSQVIPSLKTEMETKLNPILTTNVNLMTRNLIQDKRKKSILFRKLSTSSKKRASEMNPNLIQKFVKDSEEDTSYGRGMRYIKYLDIFLSCLIVANILITLIDNEINISEANAYVIQKMGDSTEFSDKVFEYMATRTITTKENILRFINCILVCCILLVIFAHYYLKVWILRADQKLSDHEGLWKSGLVKPLIIELFFGMWVYPPYLNYVIYGVMLGLPYAYSINSLICIMVTFKSYIILRVYTYFSRWTSDTAKSLCLKHNVLPGIHFVMKAELKKRPFTMLLLLSLCIVVICSFAMRTFEYFVVTSNNKLDSKLQLLTNSIWLILVTMLTVGYGDEYPRSHFGRFVGVISCVIGLLLVSLIVVSLAIISEFQPEERKAHSILKKIKADNNATNKALEVIMTFLKLRQMVVERKKFKLSERFIIITQLKKNISFFKNDYKIANSYALPVDELLKVMENKLKDDINTLGNSIKRITHMDKTFNNISIEQSKYVEMMEVISQRQERISQYLVDLNNQNFKKNITEYKKFIKDNFKKRKLTHDLKHTNALEENLEDKVKRSHTVAAKNDQNALSDNKPYNRNSTLQCNSSNFKYSVPDIMQNVRRNETKWATQTYLTNDRLSPKVVNLIKMKKESINDETEE